MPVGILGNVDVAVAGVDSGISVELLGTNVVGMLSLVGADEASITDEVSNEPS